MENLKGLSISDLIKSKRIIVIEIKEKKLKEIIKIFKKIDISSLELKPFSRSSYLYFFGQNHHEHQMALQNAKICDF